jgi:hypothetical protein
MGNIFKLLSFTISTVVVVLTCQMKPAQADSGDVFFKQSLELMKKKKFNKETSNQLYQDTIIQERALKVNSMSSENSAYNERIKKIVEEKDPDEIEIKNAPGSKENPIDKKTGLSKLDQKPLGIRDEPKTKSEQSKASLKPAPKTDPKRSSEGTSAPAVKVDDSNLHEEDSYPGKSE